MIRTKTKILLSNEKDEKELLQTTLMRSSKYQYNKTKWEKVTIKKLQSPRKMHLRRLKFLQKILVKLFLLISLHWVKE